MLVLAGLAGAAVNTTGEPPVVVKGCEGLYYEPPGSPQVIVVSDLPLEDSAHTAMHQMTQAIKLTLKDDGFRAGRFSVGYVVCDDSGAAGKWSAGQCRANARAAVRNSKVVAVIGTLDSGCARTELPVLGAANVLLVSPLNTATDLTRSRLGKIARLSAADDVQAAAAARFLRQRGVATVAALSDGTKRGNEYRAAFLVGARRAGLRVVARGQADAAYVGGVLSGRTAADLRAARARAPHGPLALAAGYGPAAQLASLAGSAAEGAYLFVAGVPGRAARQRGGRLRFPLRERDRHEPASVRGLRGAGGAPAARLDRALERHADVGRAKGARREGEARSDRLVLVRRRRGREAGAGDGLPCSRQEHGDRSGHGLRATLRA